MTYNEHLESAYWPVMQTLHPGGILLSRLDELKAAFLSSLRFGAEVPAQLLCSALSDIPWDWPVWHGFAKRDGCESLAEIAERVSRMKPAALLCLATKTELRKLCETNGIRILSKESKSDIIKALRKNLAADAFAEIAQPFRDAHRTKQQKACRAEMAMLLASRIISIAHSAFRYEQLSDPELVLARPFWKFFWVDDMVTPRACKKFDGKILPVEKAVQSFPKLPCEHLRCSCRLHAVSSLDEYE